MVSNIKYSQLFKTMNLKPEGLGYLDNLNNLNTLVIEVEIQEKIVTSPFFLCSLTIRIKIKKTHFANEPGQNS